MIHLEANKPFPVRGFNLCESILRHSPEELRSFIRRMKSLNMNTLIVHYDYGWKRYKDLILEECRNANVQISLMTFGPRTFYSLVDWKKEYFARDPEGNPFSRRPECETHPCCFVPEALDAFEEGAILWLKSLEREIKRIHMRAGDGMMFCQCEKCRTMPEYERWQPFVDRFVKAVKEHRPDLEFETDIYYKRYRIPRESASYGEMDYIMYDTFFRKPSCPLESTFNACTANMVSYADSFGCAAVEKDVEEFHAARLKEWTKAFPGKMYIHENAMLQAYMGAFQYGTGSYLRDLEFCRRIGVQGVCYEAYEMGYSNYEEMFRILGKALNGEEISYEEHPLEKVLKEADHHYRFCSDPDFPLEKYISDPVALAHQKLYCRFWQNIDRKLFTEYMDFAFANPKVTDPILVAWYCVQFGTNKKTLAFDDLSPEAVDFIKRRKLWDFMEDIPLSVDPKKYCYSVIAELLAKAR